MSKAEYIGGTEDNVCNDPVFTKYVQSCTLALSTPDPQHVIASLTRKFVSLWKMPDSRFLRMRADAPYASYLLHLSPDLNLSIVLDIFGPGQAAVAHNHCCWCVFACLAGQEREQLFDVPADLVGPPVLISTHLRQPREVTIAGSSRLDFHQVECAGETAAISLHVYGADIGGIERLMWDESRQVYASFRGGYCNEVMGLPSYSDILTASTV